MSKEWHEELITGEAERIRSKMKESYNVVMGEPVEWGNPDSVLVAAYHMAKQEERDAAMLRQDFDMRAMFSTALRQGE